MSRTVLILTEPGDAHAHAVAEALRQKSAHPILWHTADFPSVASESVRIQGGRKKTYFRERVGEKLVLEDMAASGLTIWHRRPAFAIDTSVLHPADVKFAETECIVFRRSLFSALAQDAFWVNPPDAAACASRKLVQHKAAVETGFATPDTLYTNDPEEIRAFLRHHGGEIVYKPFMGLPWRAEQTSWVPYTSVLREEQLPPDEVLRSVPGIYQERLPKAHELRVTVIGIHAFGAKVLSQQTEAGKLDWRKAYAELKMQPCEIPEAAHRLCVDLLRRLGLVFGCFDLVVTPAGDLVFLEVNEMGQFLFVEEYTGLPLLDAFAELLIQGTEDFQWSESPASVRYADVLTIAQEGVAASRRDHVKPPEPVFHEEK